MATEYSNSFDLNPAEYYVIWGALQEKVNPRRKSTTVEQLKLGIVDEYRNLGSTLLIANEWRQRL